MPITVTITVTADEKEPVELSLNGTPLLTLHPMPADQRVVRTSARCDKDGRFVCVRTFASGREEIIDDPVGSVATV